jgi:hypothetical protein
MGNCNLNEKKEDSDDMSGKLIVPFNLNLIV